MSSNSEIAHEHRAWIDHAKEVTGAQLDDNEISRVLNLAKRIAHQNARPLAPLASYALGVAVSRGMDPDDVIAQLLGRDHPSR